jgi:hypothetical protein
LPKFTRPIFAGLFSDCQNLHASIFGGLFLAAEINIDLISAVYS